MADESDEVLADDDLQPTEEKAPAPKPPPGSVAPPRGMVKPPARGKPARPAPSTAPPRGAPLPPVVTVTNAKPSLTVTPVPYSAPAGPARPASVRPPPAKPAAGARPQHPTLMGIPAPAGPPVPAGKGVALPPPARSARPTPPLDGGERASSPAVATLPRSLDDGTTTELIEAYERELALDPDPARAVRLHHGLGWVLEAGAGDATRALQHYARALAIDGAHLPSVHAASRIMLARGATRDALPLIDAEAQAAPTSQARAALRFEQGARYELLGELDRARTAYQTALALDPESLVSITALARLEHDAGRWKELADLYEHLARVVVEPTHRAAVLVQRASILEMRLQSPELAADVYESALGLDRRAVGARDGLDRLRHAAGRHVDRIALSELRAEEAADPETKAIALHQVARIHAERLGNLPEAISALERALAVRPDDALLLEDLAHLYERAGRTSDLALALSRLAERTASPVTKTAMLHRTGQMLVELERHDEAVKAFRGALALTPAHVPSLQAIEPLLRAKSDWAGLVELWSKEADAAPNDVRRAAAYARIGEIADGKLGDRDRAIECFNRTLTLVPGDARAFSALSRLYGAAGRHRDLVELHERAIDRAVHDAQRIAHLFRIGSLWEHELGAPAMAAQVYRRVLALEPRNLSAIHTLQRALETAGRHAELVDAIDLEIKETDDATRKLELQNAAATVLLEHLGDGQAAALRFRKVLEKSPHDAIALGSLARIHQAAGRWDDLVAVYEKQLAALPKGPAAAELLHAMGEIVETKMGREEAAIAYYRRATEASAGHDPSLRAVHRILSKRGSFGELAEVLAAQAHSTEDLHARAILLYRAGAILEEHAAAQATGAESDKIAKKYHAALLAEPKYRPAIEALSRMLDRRGEWQLLVGHLGLELEGNDPDRAAAMLLRQAEVLRHAQNDRRASLERYEVLLDGERGRLAAILALELLYAAARPPADLAKLLGMKATLELGEPVRAAALVDLARLQIADIELGDPKTTLDGGLGGTADRTVLNTLELLALATRDLELLSRLDERLAQAAPDPVIAAEHLTRGAWRLSSGDPARARAAFEAALEKDPQALPALRGLLQVAQGARDGAATADVIGREARWTSHPERAADLLLEEARLRAASPAGIDRALESLSRALDLCPDHEAAAAELLRLLDARGEAQRAIDLLFKAATAAKKPERVAALWRTVAELEARSLDPAAAMGTLRRALALAPDDLLTLDRLAELHVRAGQWHEAVPYLEKVVTLSKTPEERLTAHLRLAHAFAINAEGLERAGAELDLALKIVPDHPVALRRSVDVRRRRGDLDGARQIAQRLVNATRAMDGEALIALAHVERDRGDSARYLELLASAVSVAGPESAASKELEGAADRPTIAKAYADALAKYLQQPTLAMPARVAGYLALARVYGERLGMGAVAIRTLDEGLAATRADPAIAAELAQQFRAAGKLEDGVDVLTKLIARQPAGAGLWRALGKLYADGGRPMEAQLALAPLAALGAASPSEVEAVRKSQRSGLELAAGSLNAGVMAELGDREALASPATRLLIALNDVIRKLDPDAAKQALAARRPARGNERTRAVVSQLCAVFGTKDVDIFVVDDEAAVATVALSDPPAIVLTSALERGPAARHTFLLARAVASLAWRIYPVEAMSNEALGVLLAGAGHMVSADHGIDRYEVAELTEEARRIKKALPWLGSKPVNEAAAAFAAAPALDVAPWASALRCASSRAAALVTGDLAESLAALAAVFPPSPPATAFETASAADLLTFWISPQAMAMRRRVGLG